MAERPGRPERARPRAPMPPPPPKPWRRAEAGRYRSSDERFTLESDGAGRWFVTDSLALDELGLARTTGPFPTLDAAKVVADATRDRPAETSPLAARLAEAAARPRVATVRGTTAASRTGVESEPGMQPPPEPSRQPSPEPPAEPGPPPRTWLDDLDDADRDAGLRARRLITRLEREGVADADAVVRRDLLGGTPAIATRLVARAVVAALSGLRDPSAADVATAVAAALASSPKRAGLPGWELVERDGPNGEGRGLRLTPDDIDAARKDMEKRG